MAHFYTLHFIGGPNHKQIWPYDASSPPPHHIHTDHGLYILQHPVYSDRDTLYLFFLSDSPIPPLPFHASCSNP